MMFWIRIFQEVKLPYLLKQLKSLLKGINFLSFTLQWEIRFRWAFFLLSLLLFFSPYFFFISSLFSSLFLSLPSVHGDQASLSSSFLLSEWSSCLISWNSFLFFCFLFYSRLFSFLQKSLEDKRILFCFLEHISNKKRIKQSNICSSRFTWKQSSSWRRATGRGKRNKRTWKRKRKKQREETRNRPKKRKQERKVTRGKERKQRETKNERHNPKKKRKRKKQKGQLFSFHFFFLFCSFWKIFKLCSFNFCEFFLIFLFFSAKRS